MLASEKYRQKRLIVFHQGRVASTAFSDILKQDSNWRVYGEIYSGSFQRRMIMNIITKIVGIKIILIGLGIPNPRKNVLMEFKTHHLKKNTLELTNLLRDLKSPNTFILNLTRTNLRRVRSEKNAQKLGFYNTADTLKTDINIISNDINGVIHMNGHLGTEQEHIRIIDHNDHTIELAASQSQINYLKLNYDEFYHHDIRKAVEKVNQVFKTNITARNTRIKKMPSIYKGETGSE